jgi:hypothetical protein
MSETFLGRAVHRNSPAKISKSKAKEMLKHGEVQGKTLSEAQQGLFGLIAGGGTPTRLKRKGK